MFKVDKCEWCENGHRDGIKILVVQGHNISFCDDCGEKIKMVNESTGEEKSIRQIWFDLGSDDASN